MPVPRAARAAATPESGSQTTEYALVIVVAATVAALALAWARQGGVSSLFNAILKQVRGMFGIG
jgi:Flp pilus assembly pilin Flp